MQVYRLSREIFSKSLSGKGASLKGARWDSAGMEMLYTAQNRSLAMAEVAVHLTLSMLPKDFMMVTIFIPDDLAIQKINHAKLPKNWNTFPHNVHTQTIGDRFILENKFAILQVPSAVTSGEFNFLINPLHPDAKKIKIISVEKFPFDNRLFT